MTDVLVARLRAAGCVFAEDEAALLRGEATGEHLESLVVRRVAGEPLETVVGWVDLDGVRLRVAPGCFVPRRRTLLLARAAVRGRPGTVVEMCCGVAPVATLVLRDRPGTEVHAADIDPVPLGPARTNLGRGGAVHQGDLFDALPSHLRGRVDVLAVNAPYVPSADIALMPPEARLHEPVLALDGGPDGLDLHRRVAAGAAPWLRAGGVLLIETSVRQAPATSSICAAVGLRPTILRDAELDATAVHAVLAAGASPETAATR